jgi:hypothetical protein
VFQEISVTLDPKSIILIAAAVVVVVIVVAVLLSQRRKSALRNRFGPEYDRAVRERGSERAAQSLLADREKRVQRFNIRELTPKERTFFDERWHSVQSQFVDDPKGAVIAADETVISLMGTRGYPMADFDQRAADLSVDHPQLVENYRAARQISIRHRKGQASTEDLRQAMIYYRSLFEELLERDASSRDRKVA